jgi:hypothetical protein
MELYSKEDADYLINYYSEKMIGGLLEESTGSIVKRLFIEDYSGGKYRVNGQGSLISGFVRLKRCIDQIAKTQNLPSPAEALLTRS